MSLIAAEVLLWQDFRYEKGLADRLNFGQILNMVGGEVVSVGLPMNGPGSVNNVDVEKFILRNSFYGLGIHRVCGGVV